MAGESAGAAARRMREKAARISRAADMYERGAVGERATAAMLRRLPPGEWTVFHDLRWPGRQRANVDHVAVGPTGVFVIDSKNWTGSITLKGGVLRQNGRLRQATVRGAADCARAVARVTTATSPRHVLPVLCFVGGNGVSGRADSVMVCSTSNLLTLLQARPPVLTEATRVQICRDIDAYRRSAVHTWEGATPSRAISSSDVWGMVGRAVAAFACFALGIGGSAVAVHELPDRLGSLVVDNGERSDVPRHPDSQKSRKQKHPKHAKREAR